MLSQVVCLTQGSLMKRKNNKPNQQASISRILVLLLHTLQPKVRRNNNQIYSFFFPHSLPAAELNKRMNQVGKRNEEIIETRHHEISGFVLPGDNNAHQIPCA